MEKVRLNNDGSSPLFSSGAELWGGGGSSTERAANELACVGVEEADDSRWALFCDDSGRYVVGGAMGVDFLGADLALDEIFLNMELA